MKIQLANAGLWLFNHRVQLRIALFVFLLALTVVALFAPGTVSLADQIVISGH